MPADDQAPAAVKWEDPLITAHAAWYKDAPWSERRSVYSAFRAGFAAGLAHAATHADPVRVRAMENLLWSVLTEVDDDFDGFSWVRNDILEFFGRDPNTEPWPSVREAP